jgi:hypothetical protein
VPLIDDQGRFAGRWNVIDAAVVALLVLMIPVGYGAYELFRTPVPRITSVTPTQVMQRHTALIQMKGENLRAFLRVRVGGVDGRLAIESPTSAQFKLPDDLDAGTYDVALFDESREIVRLPRALTVVAPPPPPPPPRSAPPPPPPQLTVQAVGAFIAISPRDARQLRPGIALVFAGTPAQRAERVAEIQAVKPAERGSQRLRIGDTQEITTALPGSVEVPAILSVRCTLNGDRCALSGHTLEQHGTLALALHGASPASSSDWQFRIDDVRPSGSPPIFPPAGPRDVTIHVELLGRADVVAQLKAGDVDKSGGATLIALDSARTPIVGTTKPIGSIETSQNLLIVKGTFRVAARYVGGTWQYDGLPLRAGDPFAFYPLRYGIGGTITDVQLSDAVPLNQ